MRELARIERDGRFICVGVDTQIAEKRLQVTTLYRACAQLTGAMDQSGLLEAIRHYRTQLLENSGMLVAQARLAQACSDYIQFAQSFDNHTQRVVERLHLTELQSERFWSAVTDGAGRQQRQRVLVAAYSKVLFASSHLPSLMDTLRLTALEQPAGSDRSALTLVLLDAAEPASAPDRIARVIDGFDLLYRACAAIVGHADGEPLQLQSSRGRASYRVQFEGEQDLLAAARHVLSVALAAADSADGELQQRLTAIEPIAVLDRLPALGRHSEAQVVQIRDSLIAGCELLIEAGVQPGANEAAAPAVDATTTDEFQAIDDLVNRELARHSLAQLERERALMLEQADSANPELASKDAPKPVEIDERIDELIIDLNRFYHPESTR